MGISLAQSGIECMSTLHDRAGQGNQVVAWVAKSWPLPSEWALRRLRICAISLSMAAVSSAIDRDPARDDGWSLALVQYRIAQHRQPDGVSLTAAHRRMILLQCPSEEYVYLLAANWRRSAVCSEAECSPHQGNYSSRSGRREVWPETDTSAVATADTIQTRKLAGPQQVCQKCRGVA